jgi:hypothetical protein
MRRRLLSIFGALGLVTGLISSGVAAQADTSMSDSTFNSMVSFYQTLASFSSNFCYAQPASTTSCPPAITQTSSRSNNVAVCVETDHSGTPSQFCSITQTNTTGNNIAIVIQIVSRNSNDSSQNASQEASIQQDNLSGGNFAAVVQIVKQSTGASGFQSQIDNQKASIEQNGVTAATASGHNLAILVESSKQSANSEDASGQLQFSNQDVNTAPHHINQYSTGVSKALAAQSQVQQLFGAGLQSQTVDPRCCSIQQSNSADKFNIVQFVSQQNNRQSTSKQMATSVAQCDTSGINGCTTSSTTSQNGAPPTTVNCGPSMACTVILVCADGTCPTQVSCIPGGEVGCPPLPPPPCTFRICEITPVCPPFNCGIGAARFSDRALAVRFTGSVARLT